MTRSTASVRGNRTRPALPSCTRSYLRGVRPREARFEKQIKASAEYQKLDRDMQAAEKAVAAQVTAIDRKVNQELVPRTLALNDPFQEVRSHIGALTYQIEITDSESSKNSKRAGDRRAQEGSPHGEAAAAGWLHAKASP